MESTPDTAQTGAPPAQELADAANAWGIETSYWDMWGHQHHATPELVTRILGSLGVDARSRESLAQALEARAWREWHPPIAPTVVLTQAGKQYEIPISLTEVQSASEALLDIRLENGGGESIRAALGELPILEETVLRGERLVRKRIRLNIELPLGYHELSLQIAGEAWARVHLIVSPERAYQPQWLEQGRAAGLAISLYGVRSGRNWGCGDTTDLKAIVDWVAEQAGASFIALNPLHAIPNRQPYNTSPYLPNSIFYRNPIYLDVEGMQDFKACGRAVALLESPGTQREIARLTASEFVEYERVYRLKLRFLKLVFRTFLETEWKRKTARAAELGEYIEREGDLLHGFAVHSALDEAIHAEHPDVWNWRSWPEPYQDPESAATREFVQKHRRQVLFHKYLQWQLDSQLRAAQAHARERGLSIGLYHDLALATDRFGSDLWAHRGHYIAGCRVGAPPDAFSPKGQDWAFPPPNSERHYHDGYRLFAESIRKNCRHGGALRIDHVMRFFRLYWIPDGMDASEGTYVRDRFEDLLRILALESVREKFLIVGEDLGTVPDEVREALHKFGIFSYRVLYFEQDRDGRFRTPQEYPRDALVSATTHDLPTLAGFWIGRDIEARRGAGLLPDDDAYRGMLEERAVQKQRMLDLLHGLGLLPDWFARNASEVPELTGELHNAIVGFLASANSKLMALNQEDLLKETEQQNLPGSTAEYRNWSRKMKCTVEELWASAEVRAFTEMFRSWLERTGRVNMGKAD
ncbi:MAG: 4-alpha-glucanotransferase [Bryobacteraceae bacterium]|jgi:4-alpha-glucanotransferase